MRPVRAALLAAAATVAASALLVAALLKTDRPDGSFGRHAPPAASTQVSFDAVTKVPHCADYYGTGPAPPEGHAALFVQLPDTTTVYYETALTFDAAGWVADDVTLGEVVDTRHFTLYLYAVTTEAEQRLKDLPDHHQLELMPRRLLDALVVIRDNSPDTC